MLSADGTAPRLTVFTPFYKDIDHFDETITSVLSQSYSDFEYLMINDGDRADAEAIERKHRDSRIRIITTTARLGLSGSRDAGLREARGELIAFIDADDVCEPERFAKQIAFLDSHPEHVLVGSALRFINGRSETIGYRHYPQEDSEIRSRLVAMNCIAQPAVIARRAALLAAGGYTDEFPAAEDYDLWLRLARMGKLHNLAEPLVAYRIHFASGKNLRLRAALRDTICVKVHAITRYGFPPSLRSLLSIAAHAGLLLTPDRFVLWLFRRLIVR